MSSSKTISSNSQHVISKGLTKRSTRSLSAETLQPRSFSYSHLTSGIYADLRRRIRGCRRSEVHRQSHCRSLTFVDNHLLLYGNRSLLGIRTPASASAPKVVGRDDKCVTARRNVLQEEVAALIHHGNSSASYALGGAIQSRENLHPRRRPTVLKFHAALHDAVSIYSHQSHPRDLISVVYCDTSILYCSVLFYSNDPVCIIERGVGG